MQARVASCTPACGILARQTGHSASLPAQCLQTAWCPQGNRKALARSQHTTQSFGFRVNPLWPKWSLAGAPCGTMKAQRAPGTDLGGSWSSASHSVTRVPQQLQPSTTTMAPGRLKTHTCIRETLGSCICTSHVSFRPTLKISLEQVLALPPATRVISFAGPSKSSNPASLRRSASFNGMANCIRIWSGQSSTMSRYSLLMSSSSSASMRQTVPPAVACVRHILCSVSALVIVCVRETAALVQRSRRCEGAPRCVGCVAAAAKRNCRLCFLAGDARIRRWDGGSSASSASWLTRTTRAGAASTGSAAVFSGA
mmetsp:Transcript_76751/g.228798  ORF Transcript_76751/g.228798 Transcript_76751/m.228798 type:complete len:312 (+) Transcript_76751:87-1022(+)